MKLGTSRTLFLPVLAIILISFAVTSCAKEERVKTIVTWPDATEEDSNDTSTATENPPVIQGGNSISYWADLTTIVDDTGAVTIEVSPLSPDIEDEISFNVSLNTHTVELSMDLAKVSSLLTDNGLSLNGISWDGESGGHHISGILTFSATAEEINLLQSSTQISLVISNIDAPERIFVWSK